MFYNEFGHFVTLFTLFTLFSCKIFGGVWWGLGSSPHIESQEGDELGLTALHVRNNWRISSSSLCWTKRNLQLHHWEEDEGLSSSCPMVVNEDYIALYIGYGEECIAHSLSQSPVTSFSQGRRDKWTLVLPSPCYLGKEMRNDKTSCVAENSTRYSLHSE